MNQSRIITGSSSIVLDSLRICAALTVLVFHAYLLWYKVSSIPILDHFAHTAVVVFFVLSGYVIAYTTKINNRGAIQYFQARFSRLYSIVLPALLVSGICEVLVKLSNPEIYLLYVRGNSLPRYLISGLFINEIWFFSSAPPIDAPLWSLSYEFWYYIIFGLWFFRKAGTGIKSFILPVLALIITGPKILLLMPVWLMGYLAYHFRPANLSKLSRWIFVSIIFITVATMVMFIPMLPNKLGTPPLYFAAQFLTDWLIGLLIGMALWLLPQGSKHQKQVKWTNGIRAAADLTFPLYVLHNPLLVLWTAIYSGKIQSPKDLWLPILSVLVIAAIIGYILEKYRYLWTTMFKYLFSNLHTRLMKIRMNITT